MQAKIMDQQTINDIRWRGAWLRARLDALPGLSPAHSGANSDWIVQRTRHANAVDALVEDLRAMPDKPVLKTGGDPARVRMFGITSTSTMGIEGALRNWLTRAGQLAEGQ